jgi:hypothetical protein
MPAPISRRVALSYVFFVSLLSLTGLMQLPIASRYHIAAVPGLAWLGDFLFTHRLHYVGAVGLLFLAGYLATRWVLEWRREYALSALGWTRAGILGLLLVTGALRVLKNLPMVSFSPQPTMLLDWTHLGLALLLGLVALLRLLFRASYWDGAAPRQERFSAPRS